MTSRTEGYVPDKSYPTGEKLTLADAHAFALVGRDRAPMPIALGLADELNREAHWSWGWVPQQADGEEIPHWTHFDGHRHLVDVSIESGNSRRTHDWKGYDEVRGWCRGVISIDGITCAEIDGRDVLWVVDRVRSTIPKLLNLDPLLTEIRAINGFDIGRHVGLTGRKVYYRDQPATIVRTILDQGCVMIAAEDPAGFREPEWRSVGYDDCHEVKDIFLSPHIWWWRN